MQNPTVNQWAAMKRILRYLKHTPQLHIHIPRSSHCLLQAFTDSDWAGSLDDRKSTGGYAIFMGAALVSWSSKKQRIVARSSTDQSEYKALIDAAAELTWIQSLLFELGVTIPKAPLLWCDNIGASYLSINPVFHAHTKQVEIDFNFVRDKVARKDLTVQFLSSKDQLVDILTKPLTSSRFELLRSKLNLSSPPLACTGSIETRQLVSNSNKSSADLGNRIHLVSFYNSISTLEYCNYKYMIVVYFKLR
ncbi:hypothetical protein MTR67_002458 [Solanum verrucosum]|uniref:Uncharacterized protein n=1 Tax=Solanum verrucosum TaxID=315347 RepID=A0AAF0PQ05_SOLVR|nr:hypothetical protein MTR67_002458 [Solanum verrucosum]